MSSGAVLSILVGLASAAGGVSLTLAYYAWRRRPSNGAVPFAGMMLAVAGWAIGYTLELISSNLASKYFLTQARWLVIVIVPVA